MPEFLTEKNYENDFINNNEWIFGLLDDTDEGQQFAKDNNLYETVCEKCISDSILILEDMLGID